jgi:hypothetical protein
MAETSHCHSDRLVYVCMYGSVCMLCMYGSVGFYADIASLVDGCGHPDRLVSSEHHRPGVCVLPNGRVATQRNSQLRVPRAAHARWGPPKRLSVNDFHPLVNGSLCFVYDVT